MQTAQSREIALATNRTYKLWKEVLKFSKGIKEQLGLFIVVDSTRRTIAIPSQIVLRHQRVNAFK